MGSGGFSNDFARPAYQNGAVSAYVASLGNEYVEPVDLQCGQVWLE